MSPFIYHAEGQERNALADRREELIEIAMIARELTLSEGATTSSDFDRWCDIEEMAWFLAARVEYSDSSVFLSFWIPEIRRELDCYFVVDDEEVTP